MLLLHPWCGFYVFLQCVCNIHHFRAYHLLLQRGDLTNIKYRQRLLPLSWQAHAQVVLTEPFLVIFSGTNPAAWCVTSIIRDFFLPALMFCHLRVPAEWIRAACQLSVPVWAHRIARAHGVLALLLLAESWAPVSGSASPWHMTDVGLPSAWCSWAALQQHWPCDCPAFSAITAEGE